MFTGIVRETAPIREQEMGPWGARLTLQCSPELLGELEIGHSISVDGVCLTVFRRTGTTFQVEATPETLLRTNLSDRRVGDPLNLEPAARLSDFLGGHLVQGHVDAPGRLVSKRPEGNSWIFRIEAPAEVLRYCTFKGSIAVNGVSLTLSALNSKGFEATIIPHTMAVTNFGRMAVGDRLNLESDLISKYVETHIRHHTGQPADFSG